MRDEVVDEQLAYYRARAPEYDDWFFRRGRYDRGEEARRRWFDEAAQVRSALHDLPLDGADVLELAPGTGIWTAELAARARHLTVVDAAPEMLERCAERLGEAAARTEFVHADLFDWRPPPHRVWDVVLFCFWISHVPDDALPAFAPETIEWLADHGVVLIGTDSASVDPAQSKALESHQVLRRRGLRVLENLLLDDVAEGDYELIALPLRLSSADASPVRAVLREL